jgi:hypothetical protein
MLLERWLEWEWLGTGRLYDRHGALKGGMEKDGE